jgi:hypothetical protein
MRPRDEFRCHQEANSFSLLGALENLPTAPSSGTRAGLTLNRYMEPDAAYRIPSPRPKVGPERRQLRPGTGRFARRIPGPQDTASRLSQHQHSGLVTFLRNFSEQLHDDG